MNMASMDDICFDFSDLNENVFKDMEPNMFRNDPPISGYSPCPEHKSLFDFEKSDDPFANEDEEAVMGLKSSYKSMDGSYSPSSYTSDDIPATPLSNADYASYALLEELERDQTAIDNDFANSNSSELKSMLQERHAFPHSQPREEQPSSSAPVLQPVDHAKERAKPASAASPTAASRQEQPQEMIVCTADVKLPSPLPSPTVISVVTVDESSDVRQDKNNLPVPCKNSLMKVGVKRKTVQVQDEVKKFKKNPEDSAPISRNQKNAIAARENRLKKKMELEELKKNEAMLDNENQCLRKENSDHLKTIQNLKQEVAYYKSVLYNESSLATLLHSLNPLPKIKLSSSAGVSSADEVVGAESMSGGVCLHVNGRTASLEMCSNCSLKAKASFSS